MNTKDKGLAFAVGLYLINPCSAQSLYYQDITATHLPMALAGPCMDAAAGDADADGDLDLALAMEFAPNILLLNDGSGQFTDASDQLPRTAHDSEDAAFADFDNDGDSDLVFVSEDDRTDELYINDGAGRFSDASAQLVTDDVSNALAVMDLDGDGIPDLLTGNIGVDRVLISDGSGGFRDETEQRWPQDGMSRTQDLELADVDGDGDLDVLVANEGQNQLFLNEAGRLVDVTRSNLPERTDESREIRAADIDMDGDLDLVVANVRFGMQELPGDYLLLNDGNGVFTTAETAMFAEDSRSNFTVQVVDVDRDGDLDVLEPSTVFPRNEVGFLVMFANEAGAMQVATAPALEIDDIDGDGDLDAIASNGNRSHTFLNDGDRLASSPDQDAWEQAVKLDPIDVNDDGIPDIAVSQFPMAHLVAGPDDTSTATAQAFMPQMQLLDLGADGDVDILVPMTVGMDTIGDYRILLNDGAGRFSIADPGTVFPADVNGNGFDVEVADFDRDGITDLFLCNRASVSSPGAAATSGGLQRLLRGVNN